MSIKGVDWGGKRQLLLLRLLRIRNLGSGLLNRNGVIYSPFKPKEMLLHIFLSFIPLEKAMMVFRYGHISYRLSLYNGI